MIEKTELEYRTIWKQGRYMVVKSSTGEYTGGAIHIADALGDGEHVYTMNSLPAVTTDAEAEAWLMRGVEK